MQRYRPDGRRREWRAVPAVGHGVHIDIWSDVVCPWCYLGSRRLATAIERFHRSRPDIQVDLRWRAFELDPRAPAEAQPMGPVIDRKYGPGAFEAMGHRLRALGEAEGIDYRFEQTQRVNTFDAHRLTAWAATGADPTVQDRLVGALFHAYFTAGRNIAEIPTLVELADAVGLDADAATAVLAGDAHAAEVRSDEATARDHDITGVPAVVIDGRILVPGAQEADTFLRVLERAAAPAAG